MEQNPSVPDPHLQDHPDGKEQHDGAVPGVPEHDREEEGEGGNCVHCRVHLQMKSWSGGGLLGGVPDVLVDVLPPCKS